MNISTYIAKIIDRDIIFNAIEGDDTFLGAIAGLNQRIFCLDSIDFKEGDIILDIGCNAGLISLYLGKKYPDINIYAFDPCNEILNCLRKSCIDNHILNINTFNVALGAENGYCEFSFEKNHFSCLQEVKYNLDHQRPKISKKIRKVKIDEIFDSHLLDIAKVKFMKVDIEGEELSIFEHLINMRPDILSKIEYINLEFHHSPETKERISALSNFLKEKYKEKIIFQNAL